MLRIIFFITQLILLVSFAVWLSDNPGEIEINWLNYEIETHFSVFLIVIALIFFGVWFIYYVLNIILTAPKTFLDRRKNRHQTEGYKALTLGMAAVAAGDKDEAVRMSRKANKLLNDPSVTRLLSAQTATLNGDEAAAVNYFNALSEDHETEFVGLLGLMRQAMANQDPIRLLELTKKAYKKRPDSVFVCETLFDLQTKAADWENAQNTLTDAVRRKVKTEKVTTGPRVTIYTARALAFKNNDMLMEATQYADNALKDDKNFIPAAILRTKLIEKPAKERKIIRLLEDIISSNPHRELIINYLKLWPDETSLQRFQRLQKVMVKCTNSVQGQLILAEIALDAGLWGEARKNLNEISQDDITSHGCRLMARVEQQEKSDEKEARRWFEMSITAKTDHSWTCKSCGATSEEWSALCGNCDAFDMLTWKVPPRVSAISKSITFDTKEEQLEIIEQ